MLGTKTDWYVDVPGVAEDDPFEAAGQPVEQVGLPIVINDDEAVLKERLIDLVNSEGELRRRGVKCGLRDLADSTCSACPVSSADKAGHPMATLCRIGRDQERTVMALHVLQVEADAQAHAS